MFPTSSHKRTILPYLIKYTPKDAYKRSPGKVNICAFDLDHTIIKPKDSTSRFSKSADDWKFMSFREGATTLDKLISIVTEDEDAQIVIFSNQGGVVSVPPTSKSCVKLTSKVESILKYIGTKESGDKLLGRLWFYFSTKKPASLFSRKNSRTKNSGTFKNGGKLTGNYFKEVPRPNTTTDLPSEKSINLSQQFDDMRKPNTGMYSEFIKDLTSLASIDEGSISWIYYCGDAAGRPSDFSDSDRVFAEKLDIPFKLPEDIFGASS